MKSKKTKSVYALFHNVRSAHNVGSMFRTADGAGVKKIYLTGYTPRPVDRFGRVQKEIAKVALGAEVSVPWEYEKDPLPLIEKMKEDGVQIVSVEQGKGSILYTNFAPSEETLLVMGSEVEGVAEELLDVSDVVIEIPLHGEKKSLNVSVAFGVIAFELAKAI